MYSDRRDDQIEYAIFVWHSTPGVWGMHRAQGKSLHYALKELAYQVNKYPECVFKIVERRVSEWEDTNV